MFIGAKGALVWVACSLTSRVQPTGEQLKWTNQKGSGQVRRRAFRFARVEVPAPSRRRAVRNTVVRHGNGIRPGAARPARGSAMRMRERSYRPLIIAAVVMFVVGLAIGGWQGNSKTVLNTVSAFLLTAGVLAFAATMVLEVVRRRRLA
jgi:hypothetical protein